MTVKFSDHISAIDGNGDYLLPTPIQAAEKNQAIAWRIKRLAGMAKSTFGWVMPLDKPLSLDDFDKAAAGKDIDARAAWKCEAAKLGLCN